MNHDEDNLANQMDKICENARRDYLRHVQESIEQELLKKCTRCRWAKICNPRKNVAGFEMDTKNPIEVPKKEYTNFFYTCEVRFHCDKFKTRKKAIAFEETRIWKLLKGGKQNETQNPYEKL